MQYAIRFTLHEILLYICRETSTNHLLFMQNKPNFKDAQINVNSYMKSIYEKLDTWLSGKNKPNSNPILSAVGGFQNEQKIACQKSRPHPCRLSHIFGLQFGLIVAEYSEICNNRFISNNKAIHVLSSTCHLA